MEFIKNKTLEKLKYNLVRNNLVTYENIEKAEELAEAQNINFGQVLINLGIITEEKLLKFIEEKLHIPFVDLENYNLDSNCLKYINFNDARQYKVIPLFKIENELTVAMSDPLDLLVIDKIAENIECDIEPVLSSEKAILKKIEEYYHTENTVGEIFTDVTYQDYYWQEELLKNDYSEDHIKNLIRAILKQAIAQNVHELFLEHTEQGLGVNFKDETTEITNSGFIPNAISLQFIAKLKTLSGLDPTVSEIPQLGKLILKVDDITFVTSISSFPTIQGERILLKIYKPPLTLEKLIPHKEEYKKIETALLTPGITLVCGSTLVGKTHVIYSILSALTKYKKTIMTLESIAKYNLSNISQCELNENIGFNMDKAMRFIEFQTPDILYFEGITTKSGLDYFSSLVFKNKSLITEFLADNIEDLRKKLSFEEFSMFKSLLNSLVFIHSKDSIEVFDKNAIEKYLG